MSKRKTDDNIILQMLREGNSQQQIADYFGVSRPAISKRVKKLNPEPDLSHLTNPQRDFVIEVAKGEGHIDAAMKAYDAKGRKEAATIGLNLMKNPKINDSISELMEYNGLTRNYRIKKLRQHVDNRDPNVSMKAIAEANKMDGSYAPNRNMNLNANIQVPHPVDLSQFENPRCFESDER